MASKRKRALGQSTEADDGNGLGGEGDSQGVAPETIGAVRDSAQAIEVTERAITRGAAGHQTGTTLAAEEASRGSCADVAATQEGAPCQAGAAPGGPDLAEDKPVPSADVADCSAGGSEPNPKCPPEGTQAREEEGGEGGAGAPGGATWQEEASSDECGEGEEVEYVILDVSQAGTSVEEGASYWLSGLHSEAPTLTLEDGQSLVGQYEETIGSCLLFEERGPVAPSDDATCPTSGPPAAAASVAEPRPAQGLGEASTGNHPGGGQPPGVRFLGYTERRLVFRAPPAG